ncbi:hypothetical protein [Clostridium botulinum]|uniref:50S ribosomal protein L7ae n=1 Tax=Clostridium botulinum TaxID=1491 RepID=A0A9Q1UXA5_CLOBO|nr:hypothetical protein [Clostridium botulinum]AEB76386.1 putative lipoprotein [Clostridium botulinum BKT015925]KEI01242.1 hypothetical protein Z953_09015 [Clostridium botulinum D str. 16868]KEI04854.1 hypothetical protein Y848_11975 [Clostridium botulinum C/D str. Sp77]KLU75931.1 50S ribosomal protein L7ae [Clostridium botulinum V891]KOA75627.1 50S ribosomal protein L7ae [Clostridium botulinum]
MNCTSKKILVVISSMIITLLIVCNCDVTNNVYNNKIANQYDSFRIDEIHENIEPGIYSCRLKLSGSLTIWEYKSDKNLNLEISYILSVKCGKAKIVLISSDNKVITIVQNTDRLIQENKMNVNIPIKKGINRIKVVGYHKADIDMELQIKEGKFKNLNS